MDLQPNMNENVDTGTLRIQLTNRSNGIPVQGAKISVSYTGNPSQVIEEVSSDDSGNTETLTLNAPPLEYSMEPSEQQPYSEPRDIGILRFRRLTSFRVKPPFKM